ncbi:hypothetical protein R3P38DRAFT_3292420 [Favolaschia claudopus]|uniref:Uncharacterized protein n=1 Tax=Favolaschia claudopus TaxID=2862362 RepID=A0AAV9ZJ55_9AGAR
MTSLEATLYLLLPPGGAPARHSCDPRSDQDLNDPDVDLVPLTFPIPGLVLNESHVSVWMDCLDNYLLKDRDFGNLAPDATVTLGVEDNSMSQNKEFPCKESSPSSSKRRRDCLEKSKDESERAAPGSLARLIENGPECAAGQNVKGKGELQPKRRRGRPRKVANPNTAPSGGQ